MAHYSLYMPLLLDNRPEWLTFACYGTLIQWDVIHPIAMRIENDQ